MEQDRYQKSHTLFILGMVSLIASMALFALSFYILPNLLFGWRYDVPAFITMWKGWLQLEYNFSEPASAKLVFLFFFILGLFCAFLAYFSSNTIDNKIYDAELHPNASPGKEKKNAREATRLSLQILCIVILVFIGTLFFEWLIYTPP